MIPFLCYYTDLQVNNSCVGSCFMVTDQHMSERVCVSVCVCFTHRVCIARSEVKVPLARVWILLS